MADDDNGHQAHWSGTFQRLRAETVVMAVVLLAATQLELNLSKLPILGIEFTKSIPKGPVLLFLHIFFLYFASAWVVRYRREKFSIEAERRELDGLRDKMLAVIEETRGTTLAFAGDVFASSSVLQENVNTLRTRHGSFLSEVSAATEAYAQAADRYQGLIAEGLRTEHIDRTNPIVKDAFQPVAIERQMKEIYGSFNHYEAIVKTAEHRVLSALE